MVALASLALSCTQPASAPSTYQEYECPLPIGKIVREDCSAIALRYDGVSFETSAGVGGVAEASTSYKERAVRQADSLVAMLKEQRVGICNDFNTCKLTVDAYRMDKSRLEDSFVALLALKDKMAQIDAEGAAKLLAEIQKIRTGTKESGPPPQLVRAAEEPVKVAIKPASCPAHTKWNGAECRGFDGRVGRLTFRNTSAYPVKLTLWHPDTGGVYRTVGVAGQGSYATDYGLGSDWGVQIAEDKVRSLDRVGAWRDNAWHLSSDSFFK